jgi:hypothetical protein
LNVCFFAAVDELTVPYAALAAGGAEAYNPETSEIAFPALTVDSSINGRSYAGLFGQAIKVACGAAISLYRFEDSLPSPMSCGAFFDSWHISFP